MTNALDGAFGAAYRKFADWLSDRLCGSCPFFDCSERARTGSRNSRDFLAIRGCSPPADCGNPGLLDVGSCGRAPTTRGGARTDAEHSIPSRRQWGGCGSLADRVAPLRGSREEEDRFLDVGGEMQQVHDLRDTSTCHMTKSSDLGLIGQRAGCYQLIEVDRERHQPRDARHGAFGCLCRDGRGARTNLTSAVSQVRFTKKRRPAGSPIHLKSTAPRRKQRCSRAGMGDHRAW